MNKKFRTLATLVACLTVGVSASACDWFTGKEPTPAPNPNPGVETPNEVGPKATVAKATEQELAGFNAEGVNLYDAVDFTDLGTTVTLETAYTFSVTETVDEAKASEYANWIADYYVSVDADVEAGKLGLAGNYGAYGWIAFYNPDAMVANEQIGLLESAEGTPWTYAEIVESVGTFYCGAFDLENACEGVTLKVELRLTNPENVEDIVTICVTEYKF